MRTRQCRVPTINRGRETPWLVVRCRTMRTLQCRVPTINRGRETALPCPPRDDNQLFWGRETALPCPELRLCWGRETALPCPPREDNRLFWGRETALSYPLKTVILPSSFK